MGLLLTFAVVSLVIHGGLCMEIIGGKAVVPHSRPYMALLTDKNYKALCGGILIKPSWVLTAAHCNVKQIILGAHSRKTDEDEKQEFKIKRTIPHHRYNKNTHENDLMLLQLDKDAKLNKAVSVHPLPSRGDDVKEGTTCEAAGWGRTNNTERQLSDTLMAVNITVIGRKKCNAMTPDKGQFIINSNILCAGAKDSEKGTCMGDSGGPLICRGELRGVTCFGPTECGKRGEAAFYTLLSEEHLKWIKKNIGRDS